MKSWKAAVKNETKEQQNKNKLSLIWSNMMSLRMGIWLQKKKLRVQMPGLCPAFPLSR